MLDRGLSGSQDLLVVQSLEADAGILGFPHSHGRVLNRDDGITLAFPFGRELSFSTIYLKSGATEFCYRVIVGTVDHAVAI